VACAFQASTQHIRKWCERWGTTRPGQATRSSALPPGVRSSAKRTMQGRPRHLAASPARPDRLISSLNHCARCPKLHGVMLPLLTSTLPAVSALHTALRLFVSPGTTCACNHEASLSGIVTTTSAERALQQGTRSLQQGAPCIAPTRTGVRGGCNHPSGGCEKSNAGLHASRDARRARVQAPAPGRNAQWLWMTPQELVYLLAWPVLHSTEMAGTLCGSPPAACTSPATGSSRFDSRG